MLKKIKVIFDAHVIDSIQSTIGANPPETGGVLGAILKENQLHIKRYHHCTPCKLRGSSYTHFSPDHNEMNHVIDNIWSPKGYWLAGIIHSHPRNMNQLSTGSIPNNDGDLAYFYNILNHKETIEVGLKQLVAPVVNFDKLGNMILTIWVVAKNSKIPKRVEGYVNFNKQLIPLTDYINDYNIIKKYTNRIHSIYA